MNHMSKMNDGNKMTKKLTAEQVKKYIRTDGVGCLYCRSDDIAGGQIETDENRAYQKITCNACGAFWTDGYTLDSVLGRGDEDFEYPFGLPMTNEAEVEFLRLRTSRLARAIQRSIDVLKEALFVADKPFEGKVHVVPPPPKEDGAEELFRAVYSIDINARNTEEAAEKTWGIMRDPQSLPPVLDILNHAGNATRIDLSELSEKRMSEVQEVQP